MSEPTVGLWRDERHRYFVDANAGGQRVTAGPLVSVTTAMKALDKSDVLVGWAKRETARCAVRNMPVLAKLIETTGADSAEKWLKSIPDYIRDTAADLGTRVHTLAEQIANGEPVDLDDTSRGRVEQYRRFRAEWQPEVVAVEQMVVSLSWGFAGTGDLWCYLPTGTGGAPELWLLDIKSGSGVYGEYGLQLAALNFAEWWGRPDDPDLWAPMPADRFGVLHLQDDAYHLVPMEVTADTFIAFLRCKDLLAWKYGPAKRIVGKEITRVMEETDAA